MSGGAPLATTDGKESAEPKPVLSPPKVLCVDDEPNVLEGLKLTLRRHYSVDTATSGKQGLERFEAGGYDIVMSDMRMPGMDGAQFLARIRQLDVNAIRILLTGQADMAAAANAVNEGQLFRFLLKPCPPKTVLDCMQAATIHRRALLAEKELLEKTLHGSIAALVEVLSLVQPAAFGRALRIKGLAGRVAERLQVAPRWPIEVAAMLSQVGAVTLPAAIVEKLPHEELLTDEQRALVEAMPNVARRLLSHIPRLEEVDALLGSLVPASASSAKQQASVSLSAKILRATMEYDSLETRGLSAEDALGALRANVSRHDAAVVEALAAIIGSDGKLREVKEIPLRSVQAGMVFLEDVFTKTGAMLIARGHEVTPALVERIRGFPPNQVREPVRVAITGSAAKDAARSQA